ncbi:hypothetical protein GOBAR_AA19007 [Gossypium barbadense]|uniref:Uncharacterized protein n=1 Tax=Gossypium barbadense TaxID=3634 RepID=A0A2P5XEC8_GOSBA|nr:hypothetical protein GOBAR_AA19007 [Gossypium barbadense]
MPKGFKGLDRRTRTTPNEVAYSITTDRRDDYVIEDSNLGQPLAVSAREANFRPRSNRFPRDREKNNITEALTPRTVRRQEMCPFFHFDSLVRFAPGFVRFASKKLILTSHPTQWEKGMTRPAAPTRGGGDRQRCTHTTSDVVYNAFAGRFARQVSTMILSQLVSRLRSRSLTELTRQIAPPTKNDHAPPPIESRKSSQSVNPYYVWTCLATILPRNPKTLISHRYWRSPKRNISADPWSASFMVETRTATFVCLKRGHFSLARTSEPPGCPCCSRHPHIQRPRFPMVSEAPVHPSTKVPILHAAPAHPSTKVPMLPEVPAHLRHQGADGARGSRTTKGRGCRWCSRLPYIQAPRYRWCPRFSHDQGLSCRWCPRFSHDQGLGCRWCPRLPHDQGPRLRMRLPYEQGPRCRWSRGSRTTKGLGYRWCLRLPHDQGPRLPMVPEAPAHPSTKVADGGRSSYTTRGLGADGGRGSRTTKGLGCRWWPRLPHDQGPRFRWCPRLSHDQGTRFRWCLRLSHDKGPRLPMVSRLPCDQGSRLPMVSKAPEHPTTKVPVVPECPKLPHDKRPRLPMASKAPARPSSNVPMLPHHRRPRLPRVPDAPARARAQGAGGSCSKRGRTGMIQKGRDLGEGPG